MVQFVVFLVSLSLTDSILKKQNVQPTLVASMTGENDPQLRKLYRLTRPSITKPPSQTVYRALSI